MDVVYCPNSSKSSGALYHNVTTFGVYGKCG